MKYSAGMIGEQRAKTRSLEARLAAEPGTPSAPTVIRDPYGISPLTSLICFSTEQPVLFIVSVRDALGHTLLRYETPRTTTHRIIVPAQVAGEVCHVTALGSDGSRLQVRLPAVVVEAPMMTAVEGAAPEGTLLYALPADGAGQPVAVDSLGRLCWTLTLPLNHRLTFLENGHFLCGAPLQMAPPYSGTAIWEMDALGHIYHEWCFEDGFVGDFARLSDDSLVVISQRAWQGRVRDTLLWLDTETGTVTGRLAASDVLAQTNGTAGACGSDWFQGTSLRYDAAHDLLYWSGIGQNVVLEVDAKTAQVQRIIASPEGWEEDVPTENSLMRTWDEKHTRLDLFACPLRTGTFEEAYGVQRRGDGLYYINANRYPLGRKLAPTPFTVNRLDLTSGEVSLFLPNKEALVSPLFCDLMLLDDTQVLVLAGGCADSKGVLPGLFAREREEDIALSAQVFLYDEGSEVAHWIFDDNLVHVSLYKPQLLSFGYGQESVRGAWAPAPEFPMDLPVHHKGRLEEELGITFWQDDARLYLSGTFYKGEACTLLLYRDEECHRFFLNTNRKPFGTEWLYTYGASDVERRLNWAIPCAHLRGRWQIALQIEDSLYDSDETAIFGDGQE